MPLIKTCADRFPEVIMAWEATPMKIKCLPLNNFQKEYKLFLLDSQAPWTTLISYLMNVNVFISFPLNGF